MKASTSPPSNSGAIAQAPARERNDSSPTPVKLEASLREGGSITAAGGGSTHSNTSNGKPQQLHQQQQQLASSPPHQQFSSVIAEKVRLKSGGGGGAGDDLLLMTTMMKDDASMQGTGGGGGGAAAHHVPTFSLGSSAGGTGPSSNTSVNYIAAAAGGGVANNTLSEKDGGGGGGMMMPSSTPTYPQPSSISSVNSQTSVMSATSTTGVKEGKEKASGSNAGSGSGNSITRRRRSRNKGGEGGERDGLNETVALQWEIPTPADPKDYEITGTLFKRRGGMGRLLGWKPRLFTLYKGKLCYYEGEIVEEVDRRKPRGVFDLTGKGVAYVLHETWAKHENPPTEYLFSILGQEDDQKWKICAASKEDLEDWCKGEPANPGDFVSHGLDLDTLRWSLHRGGRRNSIDETVTTSPTEKGSTSTAGGNVAPAFDTHHPPAKGQHHRHRSGKQRSNTRTTSIGGGSDDLTSLDGREALSVGPTQAEEPEERAIMMLRLNRTESIICLITMNTLLFMLKFGGPATSLAVVLILNMVVVESLEKCLFTGALVGYSARVVRLVLVDPLLTLASFLPIVAKAGPSAILRPSHALHQAAAGNFSSNGTIQDGSLVARGAEKGKPLPPSKMPPIGSSMTRCPDEVTSEQAMPEHSWALGSASNIKIRGPGYKQNSKKEPSASALYEQNNKKEPSASALYELVNFDFYRSSSKISHVAKLVPELPEVKGAEGLPAHIPKLLIISWQAPSEKPSLIAQDDGPGWSCIMYFAIKEEMIEHLKDLDKAPAGVRLFSEFMKQAPDPSDSKTAMEWRDRFKAICVCKNMDELGLPSFIAQCNGKPILLKHTAKYYRGPGYVEIDINMHRFAYLARKGIQMLQDKFKLVAFECAFTVEGRSEEELPEVVMGMGKFNKIDVKKSALI